MHGSFYKTAAYAKSDVAIRTFAGIDPGLAEFERDLIRTRTGEGRARTKHGRYTAEMLEFRRDIAEEMRLTRALLKDLG